MSNTAALAAIAGHYANHPDLPGWHSIDADYGELRVHLAIYDQPSAGALIAWADSLDQPTVRLQRFVAGWARSVRDSVYVYGYISGHPVSIHHGVAGFGDYVGAAGVDTAGQCVDIEVSLQQLRTFHNEGRDLEFEVAV